MTIQSQTTRVDYTGNGATTNFPVPFYWLQDTDLLVIRTDNAYTPPTVATLALTTDYVVTGSGNQSGGSITTTVAPTATQKLSILRNVPFTQLTHYVPNDPFPAASHEQALDKLTMETQQLNEGLSRSITLPPNVTAVSTNLPAPVASNLIGWNQAANALQNVDPTTIATSVTYGNAVGDKFSGDGTTVNFNLSANPGGINNLDVSIGGVTQRPGIDYNWNAGTTITFTSAPPVGANNILVRYTQALPIGLVLANQVNFTQIGASFSRTAQQKFQETISAADYGLSAGNTAAQNLAALKAAVVAVPAGAKLIIPADSGGGTYLIDATGGLSNAVVINKSITLQIDGVLKSIGHTQQTNPMYPIKVTAANVLFTGSGAIQGDGTFDTTNSGDETTFPGLVYVDSTADNFTCFGLTIAANPKTGFLLNSCKRPVIAGCTFKGGPTSYVIGNVAYFGVRSYLGSGFVFSGNRICPDGSGGVPIDAIFTLQTTNMLVTGNYAEGLWEKLGYMYTSNSIVSNNLVNYPNGNNTDAIRIDGSSNLVTDNWVINANGGVTVYDGTTNRITNNVFLGCKQVGVYVTQLSGAYTSGFSDTEISGNFITAGTGGSLVSGIQLVSTGGDSYRVKIIGNTVIGFAPSGNNGQILLQGTSPNFVWDSVVLNNICNGNATGQYGVFAGRCNRTLIKNNNVQSTVAAGLANDNGYQNTVEGNMFYNPGAYAMDFGPTTLSTACRAINNQCRGATNNGIKNFSGSNNVGSGNQYTDAPLTGTATLAASVTTTVAHGGVAPNAIVFCQSANTAAGAAIVNKGQVVTGVSGTGFTLTNPNGTAAAGTEQYLYEIIQ